MLGGTALALGPIDALAWTTQFSSAIGWLVLAIFVVGLALERYDDAYARTVFVAAWVVLAVFWVTQIHYFIFEQKSITEGVGVILGVPLSLYVGYLLATGRDGLFLVSRAVAVMWLLYLPVTALPMIRRPLIELVTANTDAVLNLLGVETTVVEGMTLADGTPIGRKTYPYDSTFVFYYGTHALTYTIRLACTGIGSMAIFGGLIAAVRAPLRRKLRGFAIAVIVIYVLNIVRNVFIAYTFGYQKLQVFPDLVMWLFSAEDPYLVSFFISDRILSQFLSVVALVGITWLLVRDLPELLDIVEEGLYVLTRREYDLRGALDQPTPTDD